MSWRLGLCVTENVFVQILVQGLLLSDMDKSFSRFAVGRDIVWSVLIHLYYFKRVLLGVVSLTVSSASVDVSILPCFKMILCVINTDLSCKY